MFTPAILGIDNLMTDIEVSPETVTMFKELLKKLPDLIIYRPDVDSGDCYPCSKSTNHIVDECEIYDYKEPNGECTYVYAWPSTIIDGHRVYSDPPCYTIGKLNTNGFGIIQEDDLEHNLDTDGISYKVLKKIRLYLKSKPAIFYM